MCMLFEGRRVGGSRSRDVRGRSPRMTRKRRPVRLPSGSPDGAAVSFSCMVATARSASATRTARLRPLTRDRRGLPATHSSAVKRWATSPCSSKPRDPDVTSPLRRGPTLRTSERARRTCHQPDGTRRRQKTGPPLLRFYGLSTTVISTRRPLRAPSSGPGTRCKGLSDALSS